MSNIKLFIDDLRTPPSDDYIVVRSYEQAIDWMEENGCPRTISFDHDLGQQRSGYDIAKWIVDKDLGMQGQFIPQKFTFKVHSANPVGAANIMNLLLNYLSYREQFK